MIEASFRWMNDPRHRVRLSGDEQVYAKGVRGGDVSLGRACAARGCATTLSIYNPSPLCVQHEREAEAVKVMHLAAKELLHTGSLIGKDYDKPLDVYLTEADVVVEVGQEDYHAYPLAAVDNDTVVGWFGHTETYEAACAKLGLPLVVNR